MNIIQTQYAYLLSTAVRNFRKKGNNLYNFSCPLCGDSKKDKRKARGYLYENDNGNLAFKCWNCNENKTFSDFLKIVDNDLYNKYNRDMFRERNPDRVIKEKEPVKSSLKLTLDDYLPKASTNPDAMAYMTSRKLPQKHINNIYYAEDLNKLKEIFKNPDYDKVKFRSEPRLVLPIYTINNTLLGVITRSLLPNTNLRYVNLRTTSDEPFIFNLDKVKLSDPKFILEGAFDSMFLTNSMAVDGSNFSKADKYINKELDTLIFDNQNRNKELLNIMARIIEQGYRLFIWPETVKEKDLNEMIQHGHTVSEIEAMIKRNTHSGLKLKLAFSSWRKV